MEAAKPSVTAFASSFLKFFLSPCFICLMTWGSAHRVLQGQKQSSVRDHQTGDSVQKGKRRFFLLFIFFSDASSNELWSEQETSLPTGMAQKKVQADFRNP